MSNTVQTEWFYCIDAESGQVAGLGADGPVWNIVDHLVEVPVERYEPTIDKGRRTHGQVLLSYLNYAPITPGANSRFMAPRPMYRNATPEEIARRKERDAARAAGKPLPPLDGASAAVEQLVGMATQQADQLAAQAAQIAALQAQLEKFLHLSAQTPLVSADLEGAAPKKSAKASNA